MPTEWIATLIVSITALVGTIYSIWKGSRVEKPRSDAEVEHSNVETIKLLSGQLNDSYRENDELRRQMEDFRKYCEELPKHRDYEEYLLRGIARLTASLAANELSVPWIPLGYEDFCKRENHKKGQDTDQKRRRNDSSGSI